jgi:hypothetical protein
VGATFLLTLPREPGEAWTPPLELHVAAASGDWDEFAASPDVDETPSTDADETPSRGEDA